MDSLLISVIVGVVLIIIGVSNMRGDISSLHSYHRQRVKEEDKIPFGKKVGLGSIIIGGTVTLKACLQFAAKAMDIPALQTLGTVIQLIGLIAGLVLIIYAMMKYNKGIF